jgi:hypothetical protein
MELLSLDPYLSEKEYIKSIDMYDHHTTPWSMISRNPDPLLDELYMFKTKSMHHHTTLHAPWATR